EGVSSRTAAPRVTTVTPLDLQTTRRSRVSPSTCCLTPAALGLALVLAPGVRAAEVKVLLPLGRTAYQTNEWIDVSVVRSGTEGLAKSDLKLPLTGKDGSAITTTFAVGAVPVKGDQARATEHLHVNGRLLRPGKYTLAVACDGARASAEIEVHSHL